MCLMIYIGSQKELEIIPSDNDNLKFHTYLIKHNDGYENVKRMLGMDYLYNVGSHVGCGCGFYFYEDTSAYSKEDLLNHGKSVKDNFALRKYLERHLAGNHIKMLLTWGDEEYENFSQDYFSLDGINDREFAFDENVIYTIKQ